MQAGALPAHPGAGLRSLGAARGSCAGGRVRELVPQSQGRRFAAEAMKTRVVHTEGKKRCHWAPLDDPLYLAYHDKEWGVPVHDERRLFEFLILEGAQAGLSWSTILHKRENYRAAFDGFDPERIAAYDRRKMQALLRDPGIVRNRLKISSAV